ncbi:SPOR domain-containing protein [Wohlfahrtiimonas chitiniclastica]|uniref:SPOR domain-containing protein n=1 Tax=Wohlfahrtiimonas chitiniclastica TaxID=400946 RepID=UPI001BCDC625|nr:SPOR domain-containing protein [Wohlfahrtiimonas chitiniclastica]MBS7820906.1 SPOR domain-containing protein [Wohlfahrtiimonas chitiniclastica]
MNKKLQQRIVGCIALIALALWIIPNLLSSDDYHVPENTAVEQEDDFYASTYDEPATITPPVDVRPVPPSVHEPITENMWEAVTDNQPSLPIDNNVSIAEQLLAQANQQGKAVQAPQAQLQNKPNKQPTQNQSKPNNTAAKPANTKPAPLPKIELIGSTQSQNTQSANAAQPKFTWYVQVGSYSSRENASRVMNEYKRRGYASEVALISKQYKVRIGPLKTQDNAKNVQAELKRQGVNSYIIQIQ